MCRDLMSLGLGILQHIEDDPINRFAASFDVDSIRALITQFTLVEERDSSEEGNGEMSLALAK